MKKSFAIHGVWLAVAVGAYGIGKFSSDSPSADQTNTGRDQAFVSPTMVSTNSQADGSGSASKNTSATTAIGSVGDVLGLTKTPLGDHEIESVAQEAFSDPNPLKRELAFARLLEGMTPENAQLIREQMRGGKANGDQWRLFQYAWGSVDGGGAIAAAEAIENKDYRGRAISSALSGWASADPQKAIDWLKGMDDPDQKNRLQESLVGGLADNDIGTATRYVMSLANAGDKRAANYMESVASEQIRKGGAESAAIWAERLTDGSVKGAALDRVANSYVDKDPEAAAAWAEQFASADYGARVIEEVGDEWAERDPSASVAWLENLEDGRGKSEGMSSALGEWARRDPTAASQYLLQMPTSELKDTAINGFVQRIAWEDPQSAIVWADSIGQTNVRNDAMTRAAQAWFVRDREAAIEWLPTSGLSQDAQKKVLETKSDRRRGRG